MNLNPDAQGHPATQPPSHPEAPTNGEILARCARAEQKAAERGLAALVVWSRGGSNADAHGNAMYLSGHTTPVTHIVDIPGNTSRGYCAVLVGPGFAPVLITDAYDIDRATVAIDDVRITTTVDSEVGRVLRDLGVVGERVGLVGAGSLLHSSFVNMARAAGDAVAWESADDILVDLRAIKSNTELRILREASRIGSAWATAMIDAAVPGRTEGEVVGAGLAFVAGAGGCPVDVAVASGPAAARYRHHQAVPTWDVRRPLQAGDLLHLDVWGPVAHGYSCDISRSTVVGRAPSPGQAATLEYSIDLVEAVIDQVRVGVELHDLYVYSQRWLKRRGGSTTKFAAAIPFIGHSLGLECEAPLLSRGQHRVVEPGMVFAIECFVGLGGTGSGFEQVIAVHPDHLEVLTNAPARPWERM